MDKQDRLYEGGDGPTGNYLYQESGDGLPVFMVIRYRMQQLNSFCVLCLDGTEARLGDMREQERRLTSGQERVEHFEHPDWGDIGPIILAQLRRDEIPQWDDTNQFLVRAMSLILLSVFVEMSLKQVCSFLASHCEKPPYKGEGSGSETARLIRHLQHACGLRFTEPKDTRRIRKHCHQIRNAFVHGKWDRLEEEVARVSLPGAFRAVAALVTRIDEASQHLPW